MTAVKPYSGELRTLPLRNRSHEGVRARIADAERLYGPMEDLHVTETRYYNPSERRGWIHLLLCAEFGGVRVALYGCDEGDRCDLADADDFKNSSEETNR